MGQTKLMSLIETKVNTGVGFVGSWLLAVYAMPFFGLHPSPGQATGVVAMYTVWSLVRSYSVRRVFNRLGVRRAAGEATPSLHPDHQAHADSLTRPGSTTEQVSKCAWGADLPDPKQ